MYLEKPHWENIFILLARFLIAIIFLISGITKVTAFESVVSYINAASLALAQTIAVLTIIIEIMGSVCIILGLYARFAAFILGIFSVAAGILFHQFWSSPPDQFQLQNIMFLKNLCMAGGLFLFAIFGPGRISINFKKEHPRAKVF